jgi:hypothetical protein
LNRSFRQDGSAEGTWSETVLTQVLAMVATGPDGAVRIGAFGDD